MHITSLCRRLLTPLALVVLAVGGCSEDPPVTPPATNQSAVVKDSLIGSIKGVMKSGKTYYLMGDTYVQKGDTLLIEPGARLVAPVGATDGSVYTLFIRGALLAHGTRESMIYMGPSDDRQYFGSWGGIQCDSPSIASFKFVRMEYAGGLRPSGQPRPAIYFFSAPNNASRFIMEDCHIYKPIDDGFMLYGGTGHILRSTFDVIGETHGAALNFKSGFEGTIAYNYVFNALDQAMQVETSTTVLYPQTDVTIHNNTIVNSGFRNPSRPGAGVIMNRFAKGRIFNNIFVNCRMGIRITPAADTVGTTYGNNLFFATVDSLQRYFYPPDAVGRPQPSDLLQVDPKFVRYDADITSDVDNSNPRLAPGSPAIGAGNATYDPDLGAFTAKRGS